MDHTAQSVMWVGMMKMPAQCAEDILVLTMASVSIRQFQTELGKYCNTRYSTIILHYPIIVVDMPRVDDRNTNMSLFVVAQQHCLKYGGITAEMGSDKHWFDS